MVSVFFVEVYRLCSRIDLNLNILSLSCSLVSIRFSFIIPLGHSLFHVRLFDWSVGPSVLLRRILILNCSFVL